jgi:hypothetical protein
LFPCFRLVVRGGFAVRVSAGGELIGKWLVMCGTEHRRRDDEGGCFGGGGGDGGGEERVGRDRTRQDRKGKVGLDTDQVVAGKWW